MIALKNLNKILFSVILTLHVYTSCMKQEQIADQKRFLENAENFQFEKRPKFLNKTDFSSLPNEIKQEIFKIILKDLIEEYADSVKNDKEQYLIPYTEARFHKFFKQINHIALVNKEFKEFIRYYMPLGQQKYLKFYTGESIITMAIQNDWQELQKFIFINCALDNKEKELALIYAAFKQNKELVNTLTNMGINIEIVEIPDRFKISTHKINLNDILEKNLNTDGWIGADLIEQVLNGNTWAAYLLSASDKNSYKYSVNGRKGLINAAERGNINLAKLLIANNINVNMQRLPDFKTALMVTKHMHIVKLLLEHPEIDLNIKDSSEKTIVEYAIENAMFSDYKLLKLLLSHFHKIDFIQTSSNGTTIRFILNELAVHLKNKLKLQELLLSEDPSEQKLIIKNKIVEILTAIEISTRFR